MSQARPIRALSLLSGGLDSRLAVCVLRKQGIDVHGVVFDSPFFRIAPARAAAEELRMPLHVLDFTPDILSLLQHPPHGFGSCMNPCIDCHARMLRRAGERLQDLGASFLCTGEVLNERPMSQNRTSLATVAKASGFADLILRPLSARLLPETLPERMKWVDRSLLLAIEGRGRKPQLSLAKAFGLVEIPTPAGGCLLTEPNFCRRLKDLIDHEGLSDLHAVMRLRQGRHFRLAPDVKLVVGRNESENDALEHSTSPDERIFATADVPGPVGVLPPTASEEHVLQAAAICARYSDGDPGRPVVILMRSSGGVRRIEVMPAAREDADALMI